MKRSLTFALGLPLSLMLAPLTAAPVAAQTTTTTSVVLATCQHVRQRCEVGHCR
jgi:hypothetical protein